MLAHSSVHARPLAGRRGGFVIVAVLMVIVVLSLAAYQYSSLMAAEALAGERILRSADAKGIADSGIHYAMAVLADPSTMQSTLNNNPYDNAGFFSGVAVGENENPRRQGRFSLISFDLNSASATGELSAKYGVTDEASKLNINSLYALDTSGKVLHDALMKLPDMTDDIAYSMVDFIDKDDEPNPGGAESIYYASLQSPYKCKNNYLDTIEELLFVKGVTPALLFGSDRNRNGRMDPGEDDGNGFRPGWITYLTVYSRERNVDTDGNPRINLNGNDLTALQESLTIAIDADTATLILAYRLYGTTSNNMMMGGMTSPPGTISDLQTVVQAAITSGAQPRQRISSIFALVNASISVPIRQGNQTVNVVVKSPLSDVSLQQQILPKLLDKTTTQSATELPAKVNINTAPREVLMALPNMTDADADAIIAKRPTYGEGQAPDEIYQSPAWLLTSGGISLQTVQSLERYVTTRTQVYRVQSVGYFDEAGSTARVEAIIDTNQGKPRILYYRDLADLGRSLNPKAMMGGY